MQRRAFVAAIGVLALLAPPLPARAAPLEQVQTIQLSVSGRIDHMAIDEPGQRLFVAALGNHTLEVVDLAHGTVARSLGGLGKPQGVAYSASLNRLYVADGDRGVVQAYDASTYAPTAALAGMADADNLRYTPADQRLYVGFGDGALRVLDAATIKPLADVTLPGHPEAFAVAGKDHRVFINVPDARQVAVVDTARRVLAQSWATPDVGANFPLALDEEGGRLYVGARRPATLLVFDVASGKRVASLPIGGDVDDLFVDREAGRVYAICGDGFVDVIRIAGGDRYEPEARIPTRSGARTGLFSPALHRLYVAVPRRIGVGAEIRVFATRL